MKKTFLFIFLTVLVLSQLAVRVLAASSTSSTSASSSSSSASSSASASAGSASSSASSSGSGASASAFAQSDIEPTEEPVEFIEFIQESEFQPESQNQLVTSNPQTVAATLSPTNAEGAISAPKSDELQTEMAQIGSKIEAINTTQNNIAGQINEIESREVKLLNYYLIGLAVFVLILLIAFITSILNRPRSHSLIV